MILKIDILLVWLIRRKYDLSDGFLVVEIFCQIQQEYGFASHDENLLLENLFRNNEINNS